ncbi:MAG: acyltransferase family protein [Actinomycetes bacterium]
MASPDQVCALPTGERSSRRPDIQGLRALAVVLVVLFHARLPVPGGFTGVDVFFAISGFVITAMLLRQRAQRGRIAMGTFYFRRFLRLTPALALVVGVVALLSFFLQSPYGDQQATAATGIGALLLSANFVIGHAAGDYFAAGAEHNPLLNTWSLSVEEQFYLVFPGLLMLAWYLGRKARQPLRLPFLIVLLITAGSFALALVWTYGGSLLEGMTTFFGGPQTFAFYSPITRAWEFGLGALLALALSRIPVVEHKWRELAGFLGVALVLYAAFGITEAMAFPGYLALFPVVGTCLIIWAGSQGDTMVSRAFSWRPFTFLGDTSYSWYLWHWPLIVFAGVIWPSQPWVLVVAAFGSLIPALLSYYFLEQPLRKLRPATRLRSALVIIATSGIPLALCLGLLIGANQNWGASVPVASTAAGDGSPIIVSTDPGAGDGEAVTADTTTNDLRNQHAAVARGCVNTEISAERCTFGTGESTVLVLGDSQAYAIADSVIAAGTALGYSTIVSSNTGCPFLGRESSGSHDRPCRAWQKSALAFALDTKPDVVVIANRSAGYVHPEIKWRTAETPSGGMAGSTSEAAKLWKQGIDDVVAPLREAGIGVVIVGAVPEFPEFVDQHSLFAQAFGSKAYTIDQAEAIDNRKPALDAEMSVARKYPGTVVFDALPHVCDGQTCATAKDGVVFYQDETHLSLEGSLLLEPGMREAIRQAAESAQATP